MEQHFSEKALFFSQKVKVLCKFTNKELFLYNFFSEITKIYPENIIVNDNFIFFFINIKDYIKARRFLKRIRYRLSEKKVLIIQNLKDLKGIIYAFFPDIFICEMKLEFHKKTGKPRIIIYFSTFRERGIAIGKGGSYIKVINKIFEKYIIPVEIICKVL